MIIYRNGAVLLYTGVAAGGAYVYLRVFKGWRLSDLMYVTRSSLSKSLSSVTAGVCAPELGQLKCLDSLLFVYSL
jgi:hypothetical protein